LLPVWRCTSSKTGWKLPSKKVQKLQQLSIVPICGNNCLPHWPSLFETTQLVALLNSGTFLQLSPYVRFLKQGLGAFSNKYVHEFLGLQRIVQICCIAQVCEQSQLFWSGKVLGSSWVGKVAIGIAYRLRYDVANIRFHCYDTTWSLPVGRFPRWHDCAETCSSPVIRGRCHQQGGIMDTCAKGRSRVNGVRQSSVNAAFRKLLNVSPTSQRL